MNRRRRVLLAALGLAGAGALVALILARPPWPQWTSAPAPSAASPQAASPATPSSAVQLRGTSLVLRQGGVKQAEVRADRVEVSRDLRYARFAGSARVTLYDHGAVALQARADEVVLDRQSNDLTARGHLVLQAPSGYRLSAPEALWSQATQRLTFPAGAEMRTPDAELRADRLVIDVGQVTFLLAGGVDVTFRVPAGIP